MMKQIQLHEYKHNNLFTCFLVTTFSLQQGHKGVFYKLDQMKIFF